MRSFAQTLDFVDKMREAATPKDVSRHFLAISERFGLHAVLAGVVPAEGPLAEIPRDEAILWDWPSEWLERYVERGYIEHDPVVTHMKRVHSPFRWQDAADLAEGDTAKAVMGDAAAFALRDGIVLPIVTLDQSVVMISLGGDRPELSAGDVRMMTFLAAFAITRALQLKTLPPNAQERCDLTARELECLQWAARGKSEWEIAAILGISEHTAEKHLLNAKTKLGASNRVQAVADAIRKGYIR